jgi:hypothetical protein
MAKKKIVTTTTTTTVTTTSEVVPKENYDFFVLDRSGSMSTILDSTIGGFNEYLLAAKRDAKLPGVTSYTSVLLFDHTFILLNDFSKTEDVEILTRETYVPDGWTALNDATAKAIQMLLNRLAGREKAANVDVTITIITDGEENKSVEFPARSSWDKSNPQLTALIEKVRKEYGWAVNFIGAGDPTKVKEFAKASGIDLSNVKHYMAKVEETTTMFQDVTRARSIKSANFANYGTKCATNYFSNTLQTAPAVDTTAPTVSTTEDTTTT